VSVSVEGGEQRPFLGPTQQEGSNAWFQNEGRFDSGKLNAVFVGRSSRATAVSYVPYVYTEFKARMFAKRCQLEWMLTALDLPTPSGGFDSVQ